ncbi:hypothetical protein HYG87_01030 [Methanobacterium alkalithermotolerans]|uniref:Uncharacterized protein n=1 Tax=Methanobacterium alkalithermotolerans TaxID=2731220 RepID=A0A8T8K253_9EURY|nr:hypothetical protein [Methanobacterium alkalithermotolerans]QUH22444.1 hypothetical protein HYG87_01030 [Methanobacterium alkalithermotolerans]
MVFDALAEIGAVTIGIIVVIIVAAVAVLFLVPAVLILLIGFLSFLLNNPLGWVILAVLIVGICCCAGSK